MKSYEVWLSPEAERAFKKLPNSAQDQIRKALISLSEDVAGGRRVRGKKVKTIKAVADSFHRLRMGVYRIMYDVIAEDRTILVLGIVNRADLERWLRAR